MAINVNNQEADCRSLNGSQKEVQSLKGKITDARNEATERRRFDETPIETAARLRLHFGITLSERAKQRLRKDVFDAMWE
jgi:antitoxin VapB